MCVKYLTIIMHICAKLFRTKPFPGDVLATRLRRCLTLVNVIFLGIGHTIGSGIYVITGEVMLNTTGPAIFISYILAGLSTFLSALLYAEMEGRIPNAGYHYTFTYIVIGELWAFIVGWVTILKKVISIVALAKAWSSTFDNLLDNKITEFTKENIGAINVSYPSLEIFKSENGPDIVAAFLVIIVSLLICVGARGSANFITFFATVNLLVVAFVICYGLSLSNVKYWTDVTYCNDSLPDNGTTNAFILYGSMNITKGASEIYYAYVGFDAIGSAGEEALNPRKTLPYGTLISVAIVIIVYVLMSLTLSLITPYCEVSSKIPFIHAFQMTENQQIPKQLVKLIVYAGSLSAMTTVLFANMFVLIRIIYAMSMDGLLFKFLNRLFGYQYVPIFTVMVFAVLNTVFALFVDFRHLTHLSVLSTLLCYNFVAVCVILLGYKPDSGKYGGRQCSRQDSTESNRLWILSKCKTFISSLIEKTPLSKLTNYVASTLLICLIFFLIGIILKFELYLRPWGVAAFVILVLCCTFCIFALLARDVPNADLYFTVPCFPLIPIICLFINITLMMNLSFMYWIELLIWMALGMVIYFGYSMHHSNENQRTKRKIAQSMSFTESSWL